MQTKYQWKKTGFESVRIIIYAVLILNGLFVQYIAPFHYLCDYEGYSCPLCGMRTAIDLLLALDWNGAVESNPLVIAIAIVFCLMLIDTGIIFYRRLQRRFSRKI